MPSTVVALDFTIRYGTLDLLSKPSKDWSMEKATAVLPELVTTFHSSFLTLSPLYGLARDVARP